VRSWWAKAEPEKTNSIFDVFAFISIPKWCDFYIKKLSLIMQR